MLLHHLTPRDGIWARTVLFGHLGALRLDSETERAQIARSEAPITGG